MEYEPRDDQERAAEYERAETLQDRPDQDGPREQGGQPGQESGGGYGQASFSDEERASAPYGNGGSRRPGSVGSSYSDEERAPAGEAFRGDEAGRGSSLD